MASNISLYLVPVAWFLALAPRGYSLIAFLIYSKSEKGPELQNPRTFAQQVNNDSTLSPLIRGRIARAESAQLNGIENLGFFAAAVVAGNVAKLDPTVLNGLTIGYIISRIVHSLIFIHNDTNRFVFARTSVFFVGIGINLALFILSGLQVQ